MGESKTHSILRFARSLQTIGILSVLIGTTFLVKLGVDYFGNLLSDSSAYWIWGIVHFITLIGSSFMILSGLFFLVLAWVLRWLLYAERRTAIRAR